MSAPVAEGPADARSLMRFHVAALFTSDSEGRLVSVNDPHGAPAPRLFVGCTPTGNECRVRHDLDPEVARDLTSLAEAAPGGLDDAPDPAWVESLSRRLDAAAPVLKTWTGPAYLVPAGLPTPGDLVLVSSENAFVLSPHLEGWKEDVEAGAPTAALLVEGAAVSVCCSVRLTPAAHEAGVETHPDFRGRGYAASVVAAWADLVRRAGPLPLYSTSWANPASRSVAAKLRLVQYGTTVHLT